MFLKLEYKGKTGAGYLFTYVVDGKDEMTRVNPINDGKNYECTIGFGEFRTKLTIDARSRMGQDITKMIGIAPDL